MRNPLYIILLAMIVLAGCGKSTGEKKEESDLNAEILKIHDFSMAAMQKISVVSDSLDSAVTLSGQHPNAFPDSVRAGLGAAKEALESASDSMDAWMQEYRPYDPSRSHDLVMAELAGRKETLARFTAAALSALDSASSSLARYREFAGKAARAVTRRR